MYQKAQNMGIQLQKEWRATLDGRTRHEHRLLDGQRVAVGEPFEVDGYKMTYPGDPDAPGYLVYNCRCTTVSAIQGLEYEDVRHYDKLGGMSYEEWKAQKGKNLSLDAKQWEEYRNILGKEAPSTLDSFQNMKYNEPEKWEYLQGYKRYKKKVPEATAADYSAYKAVKATGATGTVRVPPEKIDVDTLTFKDSHGTRHGCTLPDAKRYIQTAKCSIQRTRWDGLHTNYYALDGATYVQNGIHRINTAFPKEKFDPDVKKIVEVFE